MNTNTYEKNNNEIRNSKEDITMTRKEIMNELENRGYSVEAKDIVKNGVEKQGIVIHTDSSTSPVVYAEDFIKQDLPLDKTVDEIIRLFDRSCNAVFEPSQLFDSGFLAANSYIGLQKTSDEELIKGETEFEGIESYVYVRVDFGTGLGCIKLNKDILSMSELTEEQIIFFATANTLKETKMKKFSEILGCPDMGLVALSNTDGHRGASAILDKGALRKYAEEHNLKRIVAIPSSINEWILMPYSNCMDIDEVTEMVKLVNATEVRPEEQLSDRAYIIEI